MEPKIKDKEEKLKNKMLRRSGLVKSRDGGKDE